MGDQRDDATHEPDLPGRHDQAPVHSQRARRRRRTIALVAGGVLTVLAAGLAITGLVVQSQIKAEIESFDDPFASIADRPEPADEGDEPSRAVNILVLGSDSRISAGDPGQWQIGAQRTDAIMLVHVPADRESVQIMSIPRDSWVDVPGWGDNKINAAFSYGGPSLLVQTVEQLTGVRIDHVAVTDFEAFGELTDELGGVEIALPDGMSSGGLQLEPGTHILDGEQALVYVRQRYGLPAGDLDRVKRQQNWMRAILLAAIDKDVLTNPLALTSFLRTTASAIAVDEGFTIEEMRDLALSLRHVRPADLTFMTVPVAGTGTSPDGQSIVNLERTAFDELMAVVASDDDVADYIAEDPDLVTLDSSGPVR
jgi:LCP family protein required for cell wall assembly